MATLTKAGLNRRRRSKLFEVHGSIGAVTWVDRKSTRLNSSHSSISYAVFCLNPSHTENSTLSLHDALPIFPRIRVKNEISIRGRRRGGTLLPTRACPGGRRDGNADEGRTE